MKRFLLCLFAISLLLLISCGDNTATIVVSSPVPAADDEAVSLDTLDIACIAFKVINTEQSAEYTDKGFMEEFRSFILNQTYTDAMEDWDESHSASLLDKDRHTLLKLTLGARSIAFDSDVEIGGHRYEKGKTYETGEWLYEYMSQFIQGAVLNPVHIDYPAKLRIPGEYYTAEMLNEGSLTINKYETLTALHAFITGSFAGRDIEIIGSERLYSDEAIQAEEAKAWKIRVIRINCDSSDTYMYISSQNEYKELVGAYSLSLYKDAGRTGTYRLATGGEVFLIKVDDAFDKTFQELFYNDMKTKLKLNASDVEKLFGQKKPWSMDYICRNLGMELWNKREDDTLDRSRIKLDNGNPYTVLTIKNPYDSRLLFFNSKSVAFIDYIDFGHREAGTAFTVERAGEYAWIVGNRNRGHGTGEDINNQEWYTVDDSGKKLALSIPYNTYEVGPYGGSIFQADEIRLEKGKPVRLSVDYSLTRVYMLDVPEADEYGQVNVTAKKNIEFVWDSGLRKFTASYPVDEEGLTQITPECTGITQKCGAILESGYNRLLVGVEALDSIENKLEKGHKAGALEQFLGDCPDSNKKTALLKLLSEKTLTIQK